MLQQNVNGQLYSKIEDPGFLMIFSFLACINKKSNNKANRLHSFVDLQF